MKHTKNNTILALSLVDDTKYKIVLHIPHSSIHIPIIDGFNQELIKSEIDKLTDWSTDDIFNIDGITKIVTPFSRIFCDVERFSDDNLEPMYQLGRGYYYTHTDNGEVLRQNNLKLKHKILNEYYLPHHNLFNELISEKLKLYDEAFIIDCHSFSDIPFHSDLIKDSNRPDICIGTDDFHTPSELTNNIVTEFEKIGYSVKINTPYSGTIVNNDSYNIDKRVKSIMIEINRKLYMDDNFKINLNNVEKLNNQISKIVSNM